MLFIPDKKHHYKNNDLSDLAAPKKLYMPLFGFKAPLELLVSKGQRILKYQQLAHKEGFFGSSVHASVSGIVGDVLTIDGGDYLEVFNDFLNESKVSSPINPEAISIPEFRQILQGYGIEGSGGARFPSTAKYAIEAGDVETLIINGVECEPYLTADYALMKNYTLELALCIAFIQRLFKIPKAIICIEHQHRNLKPILEKALTNEDVIGGVKLLPDFYPQGGELQLIKSVTGKTLKKGSIPSKAGVLVNNVATIYAIYKAVFKGLPYTERIVTLFDEASQKGRNYWVPIGTPVSAISDHFFRPTSEHFSLIMGGPMMGRSVQDERMAIHKGSGGILRLHKSSYQSENCIGCGYCADVCPQNLLPMEFSRNVEKQDVNQLQNYHLQDCIECGACAYICPSRIPLVQDIRVGKQLML